MVWSTMIEHRLMLIITDQSNSRLSASISDASSRNRAKLCVTRLARNVESIILDFWMQIAETELSSAQSIPEFHSKERYNLHARESVNKTAFRIIWLWTLVILKKFVIAYRYAYTYVFVGYGPFYIMKLLIWSVMYVNELARISPSDLVYLYNFLTPYTMQYSKR